MDLKQNQKSDLIVESVLIMVLVLAMLTLISGKLKEMGYLNKLTVDPWARVSGMVECGAWDPCGISAGASSKKHHPNNRVVSLRP